MKPVRAILILLLLALPACSYFSGAKKDEAFKKCPTVGMVADARGWAEPPSGIDWKARAEITEFDMKCKITKTAAVVTIAPKVAAQRNGDASESMKQDLPFFIAVMRGDEIVDKKAELKSITFPSRDRAAKDDYSLSVELPFKDDSAADRNILFGFQLNPAQLAYIRSLRDEGAYNLKR